MATARYLALTNGAITEVVPATASSGAASAGQIVALNASGRIHSSMLASAYTQPASSGITVDWANGPVQLITLTSNAFITFIDAVPGMHYLLELTQDSTGSRTVTWPTIRWQGGSAPTLTATAGKTDLIVLIYDGTSYFGQAALNF